MWPDCNDKQYVCFDNKAWYCSDTQCPNDHIPNGFSNVPCNKTEMSCDGSLMMLNDNRAAKPPNYEEFPVEIVNQTLCLEQNGNNLSACHCLQAPISSASRLVSFSLDKRQPFLLVLLVILSQYLIF